LTYLEVFFLVLVEIVLFIGVVILFIIVIIVMVFNLFIEVRIGGRVFDEGFGKNWRLRLFA
jgi:hypothetical protein